MNAKSTRFPDTPWSLLRQGAQSDAGMRKEALDALLRLYLPAMRAFVRGAYNLAPHECDELVQGFVADKVLRAGLLRHADPTRGRFRSLLCKSLGNYTATWLAKQQKLRQRMPDAGPAALERLATGSVAMDFDRVWAQGLVHDAIAIMREQCEASGRTDLVDIFTVRISAPLLHGAAPESYASLTERLALASPRQAINLLATAKRAYVRALKQAAGRYLESDVEIDAELAELRRALDATEGTCATFEVNARSIDQEG